MGCDLYRADLTKVMMLEGVSHRYLVKEIASMKVLSLEHTSGATLAEVNGAECEREDELRELVEDRPCCVEPIGGWKDFGFYSGCKKKQLRLWSDRI